MKKQKILSLISLIVLVASAVAVPADSVSAKPLADIVTTNDTLQVLTYSGTWSTQRFVTGYFQSDFHYSSFADAYVEFTFIGSEISWIAAVGPDQGKADVYIDNTLDETVDLYQATLSTQVQVYHKGDLSAGEHTIKVVVRGDKNTSSSAVTVNIDAFKYDDGQGSQTNPNAPYLDCGTGNAGYTCTKDSETHLLITYSGTDGQMYVEFYVYPRGVDLDGVISLSMSHTEYYAYPGHNRVNDYVQFYNAPNGTMFSQGGFLYSEVASGVTVTASNSIQTQVVFHTNPIDGRVIVRSLAAADWPTSTPNLTYTIEVTLGGDPPCAKRYAKLTTAGPYTIDPTIEDPKGPDAVSPDLPDEQIYPYMIPDQYYGIRLAGGPWHDATTNLNYDSVDYSWDGVTWQPLKGAGCVIISPDQPYYLTAYIQAESTTLYLAVSDTRDEDPSAFLDNSIPEGNDNITYTVSLMMVIGETDCSSQFTYDENVDLVADAIIPANLDNTLVTDALVPGDWYVIQIVSGSWQDDGAGDYRYDAQYSFGQVSTHEADEALYKTISAGSADPFCLISSGNYITVFVQADNSPNLFMRVNDENETWSTNTGQLEVKVYHTSFTRTPETCELQYGVGNLRGHTEIPAQAENGVTVAVSSTFASSSSSSLFLEAGGWYMIETTGGPWGWLGSIHNDLSYEAAIFWEGQWIPLADWALATCNVQIDDLGHRRVFFQAPASAGAEYKIRVNDTSTWFNNVWSIGVDIYNAYDKQISLPDGTCDYIYDPDNPVGGVFIDATKSDGEQFQTLQQDSIYAIIIRDDQHWAENTTDWNNNVALYSAQISDDNGVTWHDVPTGYGGVLCYIQVGNETTFFISTGSNYLYRMRVDSSSFSDNRGGLQVDIFLANPGDSIDPWTTNCLSSFGVAEDQLSVSPLDSFEWIDVRRKEGKIIINNSNWLADESIIGFMLETDQGPWKTNDDNPNSDRYDVALSKDDGATWNEVGRDNPDILCATDDLLHHYWKAYFTVANGDVWKIRVNDLDNANWGNNTGNMAFKLYAVTGQVAPDCVVDTNRQDCLPPGVAIAINGQDACTLTIVMPVVPSTIDVPAWLDYVSQWIRYDIDIILQYMAWCPQHTNALLKLFDMLKNKEPLATLTEMEQIVTEAKNQMNAYSWSDSTAPGTILDKSGGVSDNIFNHIFPPMNSRSPWAGGPLVSFNRTWSPTGYYNSCVSSTQDLLGPILPKAVCFASDEMRETGASFWIQLLLEIGAAFWALREIWGGAVKLAHFMVGVTYVPPTGATNITVDLSGNSDSFISTSSRSKSRRRVF